MNMLFYLDSCSSTNDEILNYCDERNNSMKAVYTFNQSGGRGQYGKLWESPKNLNIAFSILVSSKTFRSSDFLFNYCTAAVFRQFIANLTAHPVEIKWPNDLILHRKKIAGILVEKRKINQQEHFIVGIGVNILQKDFNHLPKAGSLFTQTKLTFDLHEFARQMHSFFVKKMMSTQPSAQEIIEGYNEHLFRKNKTSSFIINGMRQNGIIKKADENGHLWVELENDGLQNFFFKEIEMLY